MFFAEKKIASLQIVVASREILVDNIAHMGCKPMPQQGVIAHDHLVFRPGLLFFEEPRAIAYFFSTAAGRIGDSHPVNSAGFTLAARLFTPIQVGRYGPTMLISAVGLISLSSPTVQ